MERRPPHRQRIKNHAMDGENPMSGHGSKNDFGGGREFKGVLIWPVQYFVPDVQHANFSQKCGLVHIMWKTS
jgi:hypothetical protein